MEKTIKYLSKKSLAAVEVFNRNYHYRKSKILRLKKTEPEYLETFNLMLSDNKEKTSPFWEKIAKNIKKEIVGVGLNNFKKGYTNKMFAGGRSPTTPLEYSAVWQYYNSVKQKDKFDIIKKYPESKVGNPSSTKFGEDEISWDYLQAIDEFYNIFDNFKLKINDKVVICEIGAGYGRLAEVFLSVMPNVKYVIVDIPSSLIISYYYLSKVYKGDVYHYQKSRVAECNRELFSKKRVTFLLPHQFDEIKKGSIDIFMNIDSFQEMTPDIVKHYFEKIKFINGKYLYLKNSCGSWNLIDKDGFELIEYPKEIGMKIMKQNVSYPYHNMVEQFIKM